MAHHTEEKGDNQKDLSTLKERFNKEMQIFCRLYTASYKMAELESHEQQYSETEKRVEERTVYWCEIFQAIFDRYHGRFGVQTVCEARSWIDTYIEERMVKASLRFTGELENTRKSCFEIPYSQYIHYLKEDKELKDCETNIFELSIRTILCFQRYITLDNLNQKLVNKPTGQIALSKETDTGYTYLETPFPYQIRIPSKDQYENSIMMALNRLYRFREADDLSKATGMWYRGVTHEEYPVLPSGFVHFGEDAGMLNNGFVRDEGMTFSFLESILHHYETFRYSAEGRTPDISPAQYYNTFNYLTLMQHYSQHTNLLDWSEDFFAATYFALEDEINIMDKYLYERYGKMREKNLPNCEADAALYILDPLRFNIACREIEESNQSPFSVENFYKEDSFLRTRIPNLSVEENRIPFGEYFDLHNIRRCDIQDRIHVQANVVPKNQNTGEPQKISLIYLKNYPITDTIGSKGKLCFHLPRAVYAAKLNSRIRAQSGLFVAFSLKSSPAVWNKDVIKTDCPSTDQFFYQSLEQIQDYYIHVLHKNPFLMKIIIPAFLKEPLGKYFYNLGLSKERIYPEMENQRNR